MSDSIDSLDDLRRLYPQPSERAVRKQLSRLDRHCRRFIELAPFLVIASAGADGLDASPRGGEPGFVRVVDDVTLHIPDAAGNNRLDTLENLVTDGRIGLLFLIPGVDETLRVNGTARLTIAAPRVRIEVTVAEAYLQCAKSLMRSRLWSDESRRERSVLPTLGEMLKDQTGMEGRVESQEEMVARYKRDL
ncbi:MAG TPA: MSMEG_1061 family FMN-dependent PPOX-type flavoprotein [Thermoanaerobaculia bacterium]|nr:MSMEG_1061 family FMN-dependent PPOX-type flavoprotein [Thermoanaerobaculia bacterium]